MTDNIESQNLSPDGLPFLDAGKFIDYVWDLKQERDKLLDENTHLTTEVQRLQSELTAIQAQAVKRSIP